LKIFHGRVEDFFDNVRQAVNLVDEKNVALLQVGEQRCQVTRAFHDRPRCTFEVDAHLNGDDMRQGGFPESWRTAEQDVIDGITPMPCRLNQDAEIFFNLLLANVLIQRRRTQAGFQERFIRRLS
jgi:hypothetical protein